MTPWPCEGFIKCFDARSSSLFKSITSLSCLMSFNHPFCCVTILPLSALCTIIKQGGEAKWGEKLPNNGRQIMHCDLLLWRGLNQTIVLVGARICHNPATTDKKGNVSLFSRPKYASLAISITKGFGIPLSYSRVLRRRGWFFPTGKTRFLFFNPPLCQRRGQHGR